MSAPRRDASVRRDATPRLGAARRAARRGRLYEILTHTRFRAIFPGDDADEARQRFAQGQVQGDDCCDP